MVTSSANLFLERRGAVDAMEQFNTDSESYLTQSFRFGDALAKQASLVLKMLGEVRQVTGNSSIDTTILASGVAEAVLTLSPDKLDATVSLLYPLIKLQYGTSAGDVKRKLLICRILDLI